MCVYSSSCINETEFQAYASILQGLLKSSKVLQEAYGNMYVNFGRPLSVRQLCHGKISRWQYNLIPR